MEKKRSSGATSADGARVKISAAKSSRSRVQRGARGGRAPTRGRGRGRGAVRIVEAWHAQDEAKEESAEGMTESDYERLEKEIDAVVDIAELDAFAGTMIVDADDVELKREKIADAKEQHATKKKKKAKQAKVDIAEEEAIVEDDEAVSKNIKKKKKKKDKQVKADAVVEETNVVTEETVVKKTKKKKEKKARVSVVITENEVLEVVQVESEVGVTESGQSIEISVKENTKKKKNKKAMKGNKEVAVEHESRDTAAATATKSSVRKKKTAKASKEKSNETEYESVEIQEVAELVVIEADPKPKKPKKAQGTKQQFEAASKGASKSESINEEKVHATKATSHEKQSKGNAENAVKNDKKSDKREKAFKEGPPRETLGPLSKVKTKEGSGLAPAGRQTKRDQKNKRQDDIRESYYEAYSDRESVIAAIERGELYQGKIRINPRYPMRAFLTIEGISVDILVDGFRDRNRAMDGDLVAVQLLDEKDWKPLKENEEKDDAKLVVERNGPVPKAELDAATGRKTALDALWRPTLDASRCFLPQGNVSDDKNAKTNASVTTAHSVMQRSIELKCRPTAKVVFVIAPGNSEGLVGSLEPKTKPKDPTSPLSPEDDYAYFNAQDARLPRRIRIPRLQLPDEFIKHPLTYSQEMMCFCRITKWSASHESPMGEFVKTLGEYSGIESGISAILMKHGLMQHTNDFRREILAELDEKYGAGGEKWTIPLEEVEKRRDFRQYQIFSIDPYNARDLDDALHIRALDKSETVFEVGVHIADVTHFIDKGSHLDVEAQQRATSVYLANRVLPMLPRILCERLCSLQPQVDRLAFSVVWQMNSDGTLVDGCVPWFGKSIIRSCCKLDYGTAQNMLDGVVTKDKLEEWEPERRPLPGDNPSITPETVIQSVKYLWKVARNRRATRFDTGAVTLQDVKLTFSLDAMGNPTSFGTYQLKNSNRLVEEYMLLANYLVAQRLLQAQGPLAFIRRHPEPNQTALVNTLSILSLNNIEIDGSSPKRLTDSLDSVRESKGDFVYSVVQNMITKPMKPAEYLVAGNAGFEDAWRHYALKIPYYTHFTSPIRRYADVVVHRLLQESIVDADHVAARVEAAGEDLTQLMTELQSVAQNCNEKKMTAKNAEKECDQIFLCAYVKHVGAVEVTGIVVSTGQRSFTVYISELGLEQRVDVKDLGSVRFSWQEKSSTLSLIFGSTKTRRRPNRKKDSISNETLEEAKEETKATELGEDKAAAIVAPQEVEQKVALKFMTKLRMRMTTTDRMPLALKFLVVSPWKESDQ